MGHDTQRNIRNKEGLTSMKVKKIKIIQGDMLVDIPKKKLGDLVETVMEKGTESLDENLQELGILLFLDCTGKHESRYLEIRRA